MLPVPGYEGRRVGVLGLARSGFAVAAALKAGGAIPVLCDDKPAALEKARAEGYETADLANDGWPALEKLIVSPGVPHLYPRAHPVIQRAWGQGVPVDNDIGLFFEAIAGRDVRVVAITGTNGKSTTTALTGHVLAEAGFPTQVGGNIGRAVFDLDMPEPGSAVVLELSSYQTDLARTLRPDVAVFLNLTPDHLDRHGGIGGYFAAKARLFEVGQPKVSVIGVDEPEGRMLANRLRKGREPGEETIAISGSRQLGGRGLSVSAQNCVVTEWRDEQAISKADLVQAPALQGAHNGQNAAAAFAAARALGVPAEQIAASFLTFPGLAHRMEPLGQSGRVRFVNDSKATNADAAARALDTFDQIYWIAGGIAKDGGIDSLQPYFARIRKAYLIGQDAERFAKSLEGKVETVMSGTLEQAVKDAARDAAAGTDGDPVVLLSPACASFDQFADFEKRGEAFRAAVEEVEGFMPRVTAAS
ncbi:MAG: UDP-N-acetylmuramoyl-L-alanine--D-glutamate ligase [Rhodobiaceae bacterium]|nr:UDP-N-acetylmuramoyl-L-alanine--D-glutamate ligase [Rhodobiaceae bacterium]MCC0019111.1 UDP-N-acetylmuramoyl-L-alanine--D-glutamate ligase [Rhodobiaceae bacterium]MCC0061074.1 UDP-N-acetylmuramoyl-L-alanine--D-glutamate ligase [Rhodobiaceae bacterium]